MTATQRVQFIKLDSAIKDAESDLRSGQHLMETKPSTFDPDRDIRPIIERGEQLVESAGIEIQNSQKELVALLTIVESQKAVAETIDGARFDFALESSSYEEAIATHCQQLLETCWELGYETLFFDGVFTQDSQGTHRASASLRNDFYDALVKIDGTTFSVTIPIDFQLNADRKGEGSQIFSYENAAIFEGDKKALLAIELIRPEGSSTGLLSLRAIDLETQLVAAQQIVKVDDLAMVLSIESEALEDAILQQVQLRDDANTFETLSRLGHAYIYEIDCAADQMHVSRLLAHALLSQTNLQLAASNFILRAYGESLELTDAWVGQANARLGIVEGEDADSYALSAQADGSDRILSGGLLTLSKVATEMVAEAE